MIISHIGKKRGPDGDELTFVEMSRDYRLIIPSNRIHEDLSGFFQNMFNKRKTKDFSAIKLSEHVATHPLSFVHIFQPFHKRVSVARSQFSTQMICKSNVC